MSRELSEGIGNEEGVGKSGMAERSGRERIGLDDSGCDREQIGMGVESKRDGTELRSDRKPRDSAVRK